MTKILEWQNQGVTVWVEIMDITDEDAVSSLFDRMKSQLPELKGIIHAAGILDDRIFLKQDESSFNKVMRPKIKGAWLLHKHTLDISLDFFSLFSSATAIMGTSGQSNHAAANAGLDHLAFYRQSLGLPCQSINWGAWSEIGAAAERNIGEKYQSIASGVGTINPAQGVDIFAQAIFEKSSQIIVMSVDWQTFSSHPSSKQWRHFLSHFMESKAVGNSVVETKDDSFLEYLKDLGKNQRKHVLVTRLIHMVKQAMGMDLVENLRADDRFFDIGLDSLLALELRNQLQTLLSNQLSATLFFDYPTVNNLADYLLSEIIQIEPQKLDQNILDESKADSVDDIAKQLRNKLKELSEQYGN